MLKTRLRGSPDGSPGPDDRRPEIPFPDWEQFTDGKLRRLKRGKHYAGNPAILLHEARVAAWQLGKGAVYYHDRLGKIEYIWLQFLDRSLAPEDPCPRCEATQLERVQEYFLRCLACGSLYKLVDKRPTTTAAEFQSTRLLSPDGREIDEMRVFDEAIVEAVCEFHRPVRAAHLSFIFYQGRRKALHSGCPDLFEVPAADTVRIRLNLDARILSAGRYLLVPKLELVLDEKDRRFHGIRSRIRPRFRVLDPADPDADRADTERSRLHWSAVSALDETPMPIVAFTGQPDDDEADDDEADDEPVKD